MTRKDLDLSTHLTMLKTKPEIETTGDEKLVEREKKHKLLADSYTVKAVLFFNEYNEVCHTNAFTFKNKNVSQDDEKHLVIFWGGGTSIEGMLSEIHGLVSNKNLTIHTFNYPFVNNAIGAVYSHNDLVSCSLAVINELSIPLKQTIFYGDCYGEAVAETTFQKLKCNGKKPAGHVLSNTFTHFTGAAHNLLFCNLRMMLFSDPTTTKSFISTLAFYILLMPIAIPFHIFVMILPLLSWNPKPLETAAQQSNDLWVTNRVGDTVLSTATLNRYIKPADSKD